VDAAAAPGFPAEVALVVSNRPDAAGLERARAAGVLTAVIRHGDYAGRDEFDRALHAMLREADLELLCLAGFMRVLTPWFVEHWTDRLINIHPSLLPAFKGLDTHARALAAGVRVHGCTVHFVRAALDDGPIIMQAAVPVLPDDTPATLGARVLAEEHRCYPAALQLFAEGRLRVAGGRVTVVDEIPEPPQPLVVPAVGGHPAGAPCPPPDTARR